MEGMTEIDSHFEYVGLRFAAMLHELFNSSYFYLVVALASVAFLVYKALECESFKQVVVYFFYLFAMWFLVSPVTLRGHTSRYHWEMSSQDNYTTAEATDIAVPRFLYFLSGLLDKVARGAVSEDVQRKITMEIEADRLAGFFNEYRIDDEVLKDQIASFLRYCWKPVVALMAKKGTDPKYIQAYMEHPHWIHADGETEREALGRWVGYCKQTRAEIDAGLVSMIKDRIVPSVQDAGGKFREEDWDRFASLLVRKEMVGQYSDMDLARRGLERYEHETYWSSHDSIGRGNVVGFLLHGVLTMYTNVKQAVSNEVSSRAARYQVIVMAPYFYGFSSMLILCFFPFAALYSLAPGKWIALLNYAKVLTSVKMWPVFWNILYMFEENTHDRGAILAIPFVYLGIPALSFVLVNIASSAAQGSVWSLASGLGLVSSKVGSDAGKAVATIVKVAAK
jgi:hypothetical protein